MSSHHAHSHGDRMWDEFYGGDGERGQMWSGQPNGVLVAEVAGLAPGSALDVGCGEGADAIWLGQRGWRVTAIDPSRFALDRAEAAARNAGVDVTWVHAILEDMPGGTGVHDLVTAQYFVLPRANDDAAVSALLGAVAPGGTLLAVHHEDFIARAVDRGLNPIDYVAPADIATHLGDDEWEIEVDETRQRAASTASTGGHTADVIVRARRR